MSMVATLRCIIRVTTFSGGRSCGFPAAERLQTAAGCRRYDGIPPEKMVTPNISISDHINERTFTMYLHSL